MKSIFVTCFVLLIAGQMFSQSIDINYYSTDAGRNLTAAFSKKFNKNEVGVGLGYNINRIIQPDDQNNIYHKRLFATKPYHHLNLNLFYHRYVFTQLKHIKPFVFYDFQLKYSTTRSSMYLGYKLDTTINASTFDGQILYAKKVTNYGPFWWMENMIGVGFTVDITDKWYLKQKAGLGINFIYGETPNIVMNGGKLDHEYGLLLNIGVGFRFGS